MKITLNNKRYETGYKRLGDIITALDPSYKPGTLVAVISAKKEVERIKDEYVVRTKKGEMIIKLLNEKKSIRGRYILKENHKKFSNSKITWITPDVIAVGPIKTDLKVDKKEYRYKKWNVFFGLGGFDPKNTYLMMSKHDHEAVYGANAVLGKLTRGRSILSELRGEDEIKEIFPVISKEVGKNIFVTDDLDRDIKEGAEIFSFVKVKLFDNAAMSSEHFFSLVGEGELTIDDYSSTYLASESLVGLNLAVENTDYRRKYFLSVRNDGKERGKVYLYKKDRLSHPTHNVLGKIIQGEELVDFAEVGARISVKTEPNRIMLVGMRQGEAEKHLKMQGIKHIRRGNENDDAVVVKQEPALTMEIITKKSGETFGVEEKNVIEVEFLDAPNTVRYFKKITGLINKPVGELRVRFFYPEKMILFEGDANEAGNLIAENTPKDIVKRGAIGVTNMSKENKGLIGIRFDESEEYGPTGEEFSGTNIVGKAKIEGKELKDVEKIYVREK